LSLILPRLQIHDRRERALVALADRGLRGAALVSRPFRRRTRPAAPRRILLLRLERIGDLVMTLPAIADVRAFAPEAQIDLVVGGWNADLARALDPPVQVGTLDAAWLARGGGGAGLRPLLSAAARWRRERYDLAINFEPDIRSNLLLAWSGARWTAGFRSAGGGPALDVALDYDRSAHTTDNARRLVATAFEATAFETASGPLVQPRLRLDRATTDAAERRLAGAAPPLVGLHVSGGRAIKQWDLDRFTEVASRLIASKGATIVLTGGPGDRPLVDEVKRRLADAAVIDVAGSLDLLALSAILARLGLLVTGDTGPMHLAAAVGTPTVSIFGPSDPARYAPRGADHRVVRVDIPCGPCNRIRLPPARCVGHTPDCLRLVTADAVYRAAVAALESPGRRLTRAAGASA
jgi:lipopolysaccharide heptosyltransferase II